MSAPISLRNIPPHALRVASCLSDQTGLSIADLLRQALVSGLLVEATRFAPAQDGTLGGLEAASLAKALRRHLSSAIDLLFEYGEHPSQAMMGQSERPRQARPMPLESEESVSPKPVEEPVPLFVHAIGDDLEVLGIGMSLADMAENRGAVLESSL